MDETKAARVSPERLERLAADLPPRDLDILRDLEERNYMTSGQVRRLRFGDEPRPESAQRLATRALKRLKDYGLAVPLQRRVGGVRGGSGENVWALAPAGHRLLHMDEGGQPRKRVFEPSLMFAKHTLAIAELDVQIRGITGVTVTRAQFEPACWREYGGRRLKPDYFAVTACGAYEDWWFLEVDLSTETPSRVVSKCWEYQDYYLSGTEQRAAGIFPRVVWLAPDAKRAEVIRRCIRDSPELRQKNLFLVILPEGLEQLIRKGAAS